MAPFVVVGHSAPGKWNLYIIFEPQNLGSSFSGKSIEAGFPICWLKFQQILTCVTWGHRAITFNTGSSGCGNCSIYTYHQAQWRFCWCPHQRCASALLEVSVDNSRLSGFQRRDFSMFTAVKRIGRWATSDIWVWIKENCQAASERWLKRLYEQIAGKLSSLLRGLVSFSKENHTFYHSTLRNNSSLSLFTCYCRCQLHSAIVFGIVLVSFFASLQKIMSYNTPHLELWKAGTSTGHLPSISQAPPVCRGNWSFARPLSTSLIVINCSEGQ